MLSIPHMLRKLMIGDSLLILQTRILSSTERKCTHTNARTHASQKHTLCRKQEYAEFLKKNFPPMNVVVRLQDGAKAFLVTLDSYTIEALKRECSKKMGVPA